MRVIFIKFFGWLVKIPGSLLDDPGFSIDFIFKYSMQQEEYFITY